MNWTINLMGCMALTALTGGIFLAAWLCLKWAAEKRGYIEFLYGVDGKGQKTEDQCGLFGKIGTDH